MKKRVLSLLLTLLMVLELLPLGVLADDSVSEAEFAAGLAASVSAEVYPDGMFDFLTARMETGEGIPFVEFAIVRRGNTEQEASVIFKAVDVSARYGADYYIEVENGLIDEEIPQNENAPLLIEGVPVSAEPAEEDDVYFAAADTEAYLLPEGGVTSLQDAVLLTTGRDMDAYDWQADDRVTLEAFESAAAEMYDDLAGHETVLTFLPGEYRKILRFYTVDDLLSEDDEQVLFVLSHPVNCAISENPTGYMNIVDNEESEAATFAFTEETVSVGPETDEITLELQRLTGTERTGTVCVGTAEGSAAADRDYEAFFEELVFSQGQTAQRLTVRILQHPLEEERWFTVSTEDGSAAVRILLEPQYTVRSFEQDTVELLGASAKKETVKLSVTGQALSGSCRTENGIFYVNHGAVKLVGADGGRLDLTLVEKIGFTSGENSDGTSYTYKSGCRKKTGYHNTMYNDLSVNGYSLYNRYGKYSESTTVGLSSGMRTSNALLTFTSKGESGCTNTNGYLYENIDLYYEPFFVEAGSWDSDATITPVIYTAVGAAIPQKIRLADNTTRDYSFHAGSMRLTTGDTRGTFYDGDIIEVEPVFDYGLTQTEMDGIYLWGVKFERIQSGSGQSYYYLNRTSFSLRDLYDGKYKDYYTGETIGANCILKDGSTRGYKILPVYRQKPAYTIPQLAEGIRFAQSTFTDDEGRFLPENVIVTGRLDQIELDTVGTADLVVRGWDAVSCNYGSYRTWQIDDKLNKADPDRYADYVKDAAATLRDVWLVSIDQYRGFKRMAYTRSAYNYGADVPGHLYYTPTGLFNCITISVMTPSISVTVAPRPGSLTAQSFGVVGYEDGQYAQYTGLEKGLARGTEIVISPYGIEPYDLYFIPTEEPAEGMRLKVTWQDFTGDTNRDGVIDQAEYEAMGSQVQALYGGNRLTYVGNTFTYVPKVIGSSQLYYEIAALMDDPGQSYQTLFGQVALTGGDVISHSLGGASTLKFLGGVKVSVNGMETVTDENGCWELQSGTFYGGELYSVSFSYAGRVYTDTVGVNSYHVTYLDEYDTFDVTDFSVREGSTSLSAGTRYTEVKDKKMRFSFRVVPAVSGIDPSRVEVVRRHKDGTFAAAYEAYATQNREWVLRTEDSLAGWKNGDSDYSFNPMSENVLAGDYFEITVYDQFGMAYLTHQSGFHFTSALSYVSVLNSFLPPQAGVVFDFFDRIDASFDLGLVTTLDKAAGAGMKAAGIKTVDGTEDGVRTKTITWGWNANYSKKYKPKDDKDKKAGDAGPEAAKDDVRQAASELDNVETMPTAADVAAAELRDDPEAEAETDAERVKKAEAAAEEMVDTGKDGKKSRSEFAAGIKVEISMAVSLQMGYDEQADRWYFMEFLVVGKVAADASASYSYMTPIGIKLGIKASLSGDITAILGFEPYYQNPGQPDYRYIGDSGSINLLGAKKGNQDINREISVYGKLMIRPTVSLTVSAALLSESLASVSLTGSAAFDMVFTTGHTGSGGVKLSAKLQMKLLGGLIKKEWTLAEKSYNMFSYANGGLLMGAGQDVRYDTITSDDLETELHSNVQKTPGILHGGAEQKLITNVNFEPRPIVEVLCDCLQEANGAPQAFLLYLDRKPGSDDTLILYYCVLQDDVWSVPQPVDPDSNGDDSHSVTWMGDDRLILSWSTYVGDPASTDPVERLNGRKLRTAIFDIPTATLGPIQELTKQTDADTSGDIDAQIVYYRDGAGSEQMLALYRKSLYQPSGENLLVGDLLNASSAYGFRVYDFAAGGWNDAYDPAYLSDLFGGDTAQMEAYERNFYGQYFMDFNTFADIKNAGLFLTADEAAGLPDDTRGMGIWTQEPTAADVGLYQLADRSRIVSMSASDYHDYGKDFGVFAYVVDYDGAESTLEDRDIFLKVYDFTDALEYPAFRLTKNATTQNQPTISVTNGGMRLFYASDGSIADLKLTDIFDHIWMGTLTNGSESVPCLLENRLPEALAQEEIVVAKKVKQDESGETVEQTYDTYSLDWDDEFEVLTYTEPGMTYANGLQATDAEAALPENQYAERQLYAKTRCYELVPGMIDGEIVEFWNGEWWPYIQITDDPGLNILAQDSACNNLGQIVCASLCADCIIGEVGGRTTVMPDAEHCWLSVGTYERSFNVRNQVGVEITPENPDEIGAAEDGFQLLLNLKNLYYLSDTVLHAEVFCEQDGAWVSLGRTELADGIPAYSECMAAVELTGLPTDRSGLRLRVEVVGDGARKDELLGETEFTCDQGGEAEITGVVRTVTERNRAVYTVTVRNPSGAELKGLTVQAIVGDAVRESEAFDLAPGREITVLLEADFPEETFTETRADGLITETAAAIIRVGTASVEDALVRSAPERYEELMDGVTLADVTMEVGDFLLPQPTADGLETDGLRYTMTVSGDAVAAAGECGITAVSPGTAELTMLVTPNTAGYAARSEDGSIGSYEDPLLPSALLRTVTCTVTVEKPQTPPLPPYIPVPPLPPVEPEEPEVKRPVFEDVPADSYYAEAVAWAVENGITNGVSATSFAPEKPCTRAEIVTFLWRMAGCPEAAEPADFVDVAAGSYYAEAVAWAVEAGVTVGTSAETFDPDAVCTRAQTVTFLARFAQADMAGSSEFADVSADSYYAGAVAWAAETGVTKGTSADTFSPEQLCDRAQIVTFLYRYSKIQ